MKTLLIAAFILMTFPEAGRPAHKAPEPTADHILILKSERTMRLYAHDKLVKEYKVALGGNPVGPKQQQGDRRTPEGRYKIDLRNPHSQFHLSLRVSYPNAQDREWARLHHVDPGGAIMIHGLPSAYAYLGAEHRKTDWTDGCIAVTNEEIEEIWAMVQIGATVEIRP